MPNADSTIISSIRDLLNKFEAAPADEQPKNIVASPGESLVIFGDGHVEVVSAAEQPKACAGFRCISPVGCRIGHCHNCDNCGQPFSDPCHQPPAEQAQQPAPTDVPPMPLVWCSSSAVDQPVCDEHHVRALHAACERIAREREEWEEKAGQFSLAAHEAKMVLLGEQTRSIGIERELDEVRRELEAERARADRAVQDRRDALSVTSRDGLLSSEWVARTGKAEREREEQRARADKAEEGCFKLTASLEGSELLTAIEKERREKAEAELAALRAQEPVAWVTPHPDTPGYFRFHQWIPLAGTPNVRPLYAAPVASIPLAQHEAELAQARRDERERVAAVLKNRGWHDATAVVLDLPDAGGEVGK